MSFLETTAYIGNFILFINLLVYSKSYRNSNSVAFKVFTFYLLIILIIQIISTYLRNLYVENIFLSHYYFIGQFILLSLFFKLILKNKPIKKVVKLLLTLTLTILCIYYIIYPTNYYKFNVIEIILTSIPLLIYCFSFFIQTIDADNKKFIYIISGFFLYLLCSTLLFTAGNISTDFRKIIWNTNAVLYIIYQLLIFIEWYKHFRKPIKESTQLDV